MSKNERRTFLVELFSVPAFGAAIYFFACALA